MTDKKKKKKRKSGYPFYGSVFAPIFPSHSTTPVTTHDDADSGSGSDSDSDDAPASAPAVISNSIIPPSRKRTLHEMRMVFKSVVGPQINEVVDAAWAGYGAPNMSTVLMKHSTPQVVGPGFDPIEPGQGGRYDFQKSPGLGFRTEAAWKIWRSVLEIIPRAPTLTVSAIIQGAMQRSGVKFGDVDTAEMRLLEMGIEWYLNNPGKFTQPKDNDGGPAGGGSISGGA